MPNLKPTRWISALLSLGVLLMLAGLLLLVVPPNPVNAQPPSTPFPLYSLPDSRLATPVSSNLLALGKDNRTLVAANTFNNSISIITLPDAKLSAEIPVGNDPRSVALTADGLRAVTANRADGTLSVVDLATQQVTTIKLNGVYPYGVVLGADDTAYVSLEGSNAIDVVNLQSATVLQTIPVPAAPAGLALLGDFLYVTHFWSGQISLVYLPDARVVQTSSTGLDTSISQGIELDVTRGIAYLPQTRSNAQNTALTYDSVVFPVVNRVDLHNLQVQRSNRIALDSADRPVNMPFAIALDRFRQWIYVANAGSNDVSVIDLNSGAMRGHIPVGSSPRGLLLNRDNSLLFVNNALEGSLSIIETRNLTVVDKLPISDFKLSVDTIVAAQLFYGASDPRMSFGSWLSCANCHFDGMSDGRVWQGMVDGPRNTPVLYNLLETPPYNWSGNWDELADAEIKIHHLQGGTGLIADQTLSPALGSPHAGLSLDLDSLTAYIATFTGPTQLPVKDAALVKHGADIFGQQNCASCHAGVAGTDLKSHDVGTGTSPNEKAGTAFDTPTLRWLWSSAPYFHDGSAATLRDVFTMPGAHQLIGKISLEDIDA
ncbi:MAG: hypothetical protein ABI970_18190, partial [Chloroflexota bacterium]